jgi:hypothetical protein
MSQHVRTTNRSSGRDRQRRRCDREHRDEYATVALGWRKIAAMAAYLYAPGWCSLRIASIKRFASDLVLKPSTTTLPSARDNVTSCGDVSDGGL